MTADHFSHETQQERDKVEASYAVIERRSTGYVTENVVYTTKELRDIFPPGELVSVLLDEIDRLRPQLQETTRLLEQVKAYARHKSDCWLTFETRNLVPSEGGIGMRFRQSSDGDPVCTCGLDTLLTSRSSNKEQK